jgi:ribosomal protein S27AE
MYQFKEILLKCCPKCGAEPCWTPIKMIDSRGRDRYPYVCGSCGLRTQLFCKKIDVPYVIREGDASVIMPKKKGFCEKCGNFDYLEIHHWAPRKLFSDYNEWPTSCLCMDCHKKWHQVVTGDLIKSKVKRNATA